jgi:hypothetical protein
MRSGLPTLRCWMRSYSNRAATEDHFSWTPAPYARRKSVRFHCLEKMQKPYCMTPGLHGMDIEYAE